MGSSKPKLRLIPTEHLVILLSLSEEIELKESERFKTLSEATVGIKEQKYCDDLYAKVCILNQGYDIQ